MGDVVSLAAKRKEKEAKTQPKLRETEEDSIEVRINRIRASIVRIDALIQELKEMNHDATNSGN
jgi:hypothetical protein